MDLRPCLEPLRSAGVAFRFTSVGASRTSASTNLTDTPQGHMVSHHFATSAACVSRIVSVADVAPKWVKLKLTLKTTTANDMANAIVRVGRLVCDAARPVGVKCLKCLKCLKRVKRVKCLKSEV